MFSFQMSRCSMDNTHFERRSCLIMSNLRLEDNFQSGLSLIKIHLDRTSKNCHSDIEALLNYLYNKDKNG